MKCPYCQREMQLGFVQCRDGVNWTPRKQPVAALSGLGRGRVSLQNGAGTRDSVVYAHHCGQCSVVVIPYGDSPLCHDRE